MEENEKRDRDEIYTKVVRAGKRTYFFDANAMKSGELFITVTESKKRIDAESGKFFYEKHKIFLYKEDFEKFEKALADIVRFVKTGEKTEDEEEPTTINGDSIFVDFPTGI